MTGSDQKVASCQEVTSPVTGSVNSEQSEDSKFVLHITIK